MPEENTQKAIGPQETVNTGVSTAEGNKVGPASGPVSLGKIRKEDNPTEDKPACEDDAEKMDDDTIKSLMPLYTAGKLSKAIAASFEKAIAKKAELVKSMREQALEDNVANLNKKVDAMTAQIGELANLFKNIKMPTPAEIAKSLVDGTQTVQKTAATPQMINPDNAAPAAAAPLVSGLAGMYKLDFSEVHNLNERTRPSGILGAGIGGN